MRADTTIPTELTPLRRGELGRLAERLREMDRRSPAPGAVVRMPWLRDAQDGEGGRGEGWIGLGAVHEWVGLMEESARPLTPISAPHAEPTHAPGDSSPPPVHLPIAQRGRSAVRSVWVPPITLLTHTAVAAARAVSRSMESGSPGVIVFVGARVWPSWSVWREACGAAAGGMAAGGAGGMGEGVGVGVGVGGVGVGGVGVSRHVLVDPPDEDTRVWAIDLALRTPGVVVVADAAGLEGRGRAGASRRFQLAAEAGGTVALLAHPPNPSGRAEEEARVSFAASRWVVSPAVSTGAVGAVGAGGGVGGGVRWVVELVRRKGVRAMETPRWMVERVRGVLVEADSVRGVVPEVRGGGYAPRAAS